MKLKRNKETKHHWFHYTAAFMPFLSWIPKNPTLFFFKPGKFFPWDTVRIQTNAVETKSNKGSAKNNSTSAVWRGCAFLQVADTSNNITFGADTNASFDSSRGFKTLEQTAWNSMSNLDGCCYVTTVLMSLWMMQTMKHVLFSDSEVSYRNKAYWRLSTFTRS